MKINKQKYSTISIQEAVTKVKKQEISAVELVSYHLNLAKTLGQELNAFITVFDESLEKAREIDLQVRVGKQLGMLAGIPFTVKDVIMTKGKKTTAGSRMLENHIAQYSATVVEKLEQEGAIIIGKTNCDPFAFGGSGENSGYGPTLNPLDTTRVPGGSSSGAAASLAAGIGLFAIGTDTGGSVRQPAAFTGLVGLKATYGRNSRYGLISMASSFDTPGIIARNVFEAGLVEQIIAGKDIKDNITYDIPVGAYYNVNKLTDSFKGVKVGVPRQYFEQGIDVEVEKIVRGGITSLEKKGVEVIELDFELLKKAIAVYYVLVPSEISSTMSRYDGFRYGASTGEDFWTNLVETRGAKLEEEVKRRIMIGTYALSAGYADEYYKTASKVRVKLTREMEQIFKQVDFIVGPTSPCVAFKLGSKTQDPLSMYLADVYTVTANIVGSPAISLNCGFNSEGLPVGFQIMAKRFDEEKLLKFAAKVEKVFNKE